jgi:hypothetical protein
VAGTVQSSRAILPIYFLYEFKTTMPPLKQGDIMINPMTNFKITYLCKCLLSVPSTCVKSIHRTQVSFFWTCSVGPVMTPCGQQNTKLIFSPKCCKHQISPVQINTSKDSLGFIYMLAFEWILRASLFLLKLILCAICNVQWKQLFNKYTTISTRLTVNLYFRHRHDQILQSSLHI